MFGASLLGANSFGATAEPDRKPDSVWMADFDSSYSVWLDPTNRQAGIKGLTSDVALPLWKPGYCTTCDVITGADGVLSIKHTNPTGGNYSDVTMQMTDWRGGNLIQFAHIAEQAGKKVDTLGGMYVDMSMGGQVTMVLEYKVDRDCQLRVDLVDANGRQGNGKVKSDYQNSQRVALKKGSDFQKVTIDWAYNMFDFYSGGYWDAKNGMRDGEGQVTDAKVRDESKPFGKEYVWSTKKKADGTDTTYKREVKEEDPIPVDSRSIVKISMIIDDGDQGTDGDVTNLELKNMVLGKVEGAVEFKPFTVGTTLEYHPEDAFLVLARGDGFVSDEIVSSAKSALVVYPNPAKGQITVNENVKVTTVAGVATGVVGNGVLDISSLVVGTYYVVGTTGTTTLIVE